MIATVDHIYLFWADHPDILLAILAALSEIEHTHYQTQFVVMNTMLSDIPLMASNQNGWKGPHYNNQYS